jgi:MFS family permease
MEDQVVCGSLKGNLVPLALLLQISFLVGLAQTYFGLSAYSLCLSTFELKYVLYAVAFASVLLPLAGQVYSWLSARLAFVRMIYLTFGLLSILVVVQWFGTLVDHTGYFQLTLVFSCEFLSVFSGLVFWELVSRVFPGGKDGRVFAVLGAGFPVARAAGGATTAVFTQQFPTVHLLLAASLALSVSAILMLVLARRCDEGVTGIAKLATTADPSHEDNSDTWTKKTALILVFCASGVLGYSFVNHIFDDVASSYFANEAQLAQCLGKMDVLIGVVQFFFMTVASGWFIGRCGPHAGLLVLPSVVAFGAISMLIAWSSAEHLAPVFWIAASTKVMDKVLRMSLENPAMMIIYQTFASDSRARLMACVQTKIKPLAAAAGGGLLILINTVMGWELGVKIALVLGIAAIWCLTAVMLGAAFRERKARSARSKRDLAKWRRRPNHRVLSVRMCGGERAQATGDACSPPLDRRKRVVDRGAQPICTHPPPGRPGCPDRRFDADADAVYPLSLLANRSLASASEGNKAGPVIWLAPIDFAGNWLAVRIRGSSSGSVGCQSLTVFQEV